MARRFQFSIRLMLAVTAIFAIVAWAATWGPSVASVIAMPAIAAFFASICAVAYFGAVGRAKAFWLGATLPMAVGAFAASSEAQSLAWSWIQQTPADFDGDLPLLYDGARFVMFGYLAFAPLNGLLCALVHWLIWPKQPEES